ncbi:MAG: type II secretion system F family protein [Deltaproteobacteria bacterium]|nr:type II secretion system F family protein [Deltaproteobacteria bacterium]
MENILIFMAGTSLSGWFAWTFYPNGAGSSQVIVSAILFLAKPFLKIRLRKKFFHQYPDALEMIANHLTAGQSFSSSFQNLCKSGEEPLAGEFESAWHTFQLSGSLEKGLSLLSERWPHWGIEAFVTAISVSRHTGANLAEILRLLAESVREEKALQDRIGTLTLQARIQGMIAVAIPWLLLIAELFIYPQSFAETLRTSEGKLCLMAAILLDGCGAGLLYWMAREREE